MPDVRRYIYNPFSRIVTLFIVLILIILFAFIFFGLVSVAFARIGFSTSDIVLLLIATLVGSFINIPLFTLRSHEPVVTDTYVTVFGMTYRVPAITEGSRKTVIAVNVGGAIIPTGVSLYLFWQFPEIIGLAALGITLVAIVSHLVARPVRGVGIVSPALVSPIVAAVFALVASSQLSSVNGAFALAYVSGVLGTLIGADLTNLRAIKGIGAPVASIGGAGTFDGVFLTGIIAVLLT
ncbi:MAG: DUF1614 domain-containing protein [Euryarchaeota archaeon]|nr:DUF1614 domain-containing protein [Euryarchaeota archaeon]